MNKFLLLILVIGGPLLSMAQEADTMLLITPFGKPEGKEVSSKMGKEGGTLISEDENVKLIIPPGAIDKKTSISIQASTNTMQSGGRKSYKLLPEEIRFRQPVQLIFYYVGDEQLDWDLQGIAMQNQQGQWYDCKDIVVDTINQTITASIKHFSYWVNYEKVGLLPRNAKVKVNGSLQLFIHNFYTDHSNDDALTVIKVPALPEWTVNGILDGDAESGVVRTVKGDSKLALYRAPSSMPNRNPVQVTADFKNVKYKIGKTKIRNLKVSTKILVYGEAYEVKVEMWGKNTGYCNLGEFTDESSFVVLMDGAKTKVLDIKNNLVKMTGMEKCKCSPEWTNKNTTLGLIHISGIQKIIVSPPDTLNNFPHQRVQIQFKPAKAVFPIFRFNCPNIGGMPPTLPSMRALPLMIDFMAGGKEELLYESTRETERIKITVKPVTDDGMN